MNFNQVLHFTKTQTGYELISITKKEGRITVTRNTKESPPKCWQTLWWFQQQRGISSEGSGNTGERSTMFDTVNQTTWAECKYEALMSETSRSCVKDFKVAFHSSHHKCLLVVTRMFNKMYPLTLALWKSIWCQCKGEQLDTFSIDSRVSVYFSSVCLISVRQQLRTSTSTCFHTNRQLRKNSGLQKKKKKLFWRSQGHRVYLEN